jgi:hypothetical protein
VCSKNLAFSEGESMSLKIYKQFEDGDEIQRDDKNYVVVGTVGINSYLVVEKDAEQPAPVKLIQLTELKMITSSSARIIKADNK